MTKIKTAGAFILCWLALHMVGCGGAIEFASGERNVISGKLTEMAKAWEKGDAQKISAINAANPYRQDAQKAILDYANGEHSEAVLKFNTAWGSLVAIDKAIKAAEAGMRKDVAPAIANGYAAISKILELLTKQGIKIPGVN